MRLARSVITPLAFALGGAPALAGQVPVTGGLSSVERTITRHAEDHNAEGLALLERVVNINSGTQNVAGVRAVGEIFQKEFEALGFATRWEDGAAFHRAGHLIAEHAAPGPRLLLIGHLDTVFEPDHPFQRFERVDSTHARGPGVIDMKGGDVIIVQALKALKAAGTLERTNLIVVLHGDEEDPGEPIALARRALIAAGRGADAALGFEDGDGDPHTAVIARRGVSSWLLTVTATPAHSSQIFREDVGAGAIYETARVLQGFRERLGGDPLLTFNPGVALGGTGVTLDSTHTRGGADGKSNVVAQRMLVAGDLRTMAPERLTFAQEVMQEIVATPLPHTTSTLRFDEGYPPMAPTDGNRKLLMVYDRVSQDLGYGPVGIDNPARAGAADVSFVASLVPMAIDGLGLAGSDDHTAGETADLTMLPVLTKRAAILLHRLTRPTSP